MYNLKKEKSKFEEEFKVRHKKSWKVEKERTLMDLLMKNEYIHFLGYYESYNLKDIIFKDNKVFLKKDGKEYPLIIQYSDDLYIEAENLLTPLKETNFKKIFPKDLERSLYNFLLNQIYSRYKIVTPIGLLKNLLKVQWVIKARMKSSLMQLDQDLKLTTVKTTSKTGKILNRVRSSYLMYPLSISGAARAYCDWKKHFPDEYQNRELFIQGGKSGIVLSEKGNYQTAFVEVFPQYIKNNNGELFSAFVRGEGSSLEEAEKDVFEKVKKIKECTSHNWVRVKNRNDGYAKCANCNVYKMELEPLTKCKVCNIPTKYSSDKNGDMHCMKHYYELDVTQAVNEQNSWGDPKDNIFRFQVDKKIFEAVGEKLFDEVSKKQWNLISTVKAKTFPILGKSSMTKEEFRKGMLIQLDAILYDLKK